MASAYRQIETKAANIFERAGVSGTVASIATAGTLALLARYEGKRAVQPMNATSHWLHGSRAGRVRNGDLTHTLVGYVTHHISSIFWATLLERWLGPRRSLFAIAPRAAAVTALAALVDYRLMPRRLTPGWEAVLSPRSMRAAFAVMALGLAVGALASRNGKARRRP
jgi:hypothetical protein